MDKLVILSYDKITKMVCVNTPNWCVQIHLTGVCKYT